MPKNKLNIYPQTLSMPKCVIMKLFLVLAGTSSIVVPSGTFVGRVTYRCFSSQLYCRGIFVAGPRNCGT